MTAEESLRSLQRAFARTLTGRTQGARPSATGGPHAVADASGSAARERALAERIRTDRDISADERLAVYGHAWFARLHAALREDFGALHAAIGDAAFHDLAKLYFLAHPPHSHTLRDLGFELEEFLRGPVAGFFRERWPFAADLAALEWALVEVFDAPDAPVLERERLARLPAEAWNGLRLALVPAHRRLRLDWPVDRLRTTTPSDADATPSPASAFEATPTQLLIHRRAERTFFRALEPLEASALDAFAAGLDFGSVCVQIAEVVGEEAAPAALLGLLERWLAEGCLVDPDVARAPDVPAPQRVRAARNESASPSGSVAIPAQTTGARTCATS